MIEHTFQEVTRAVLVDTLYSEIQKEKIIAEGKRSIENVFKLFTQTESCELVLHSENKPLVCIRKTKNKIEVENI